MKVIKQRMLMAMFLALSGGLYAQEDGLRYIPATVDFNVALSDWDGFGFNYVETAQTRHYDSYPQDYGGFSLLGEKEQQEILNMVFGKDGLGVQIVKMFLDPYHQAEPGADFNHEKTTLQMRNFVKGGLDISRERGEELEIITTLYGPPAWATKQKFIGGRDLDPGQSDALCNYMAHWVSYLCDHDYPVKYLSLHNEGEDFYRWDFEKGTQRLQGFDYNMYWPPEQVNDFLKRMPEVLLAYGLNDVGVSNGEPSNWTRFYHWGYATALANDKEALSGLGLLTTHGFINGDMKKLSYGTATLLTTNLLHEQRPELHAWVTSFSWGDMGFDFVRMVHENIYSGRVNAIIPWAGIQYPAAWVDGDPNPGTAFSVNTDGSYEVLPGYYFYKQLTRAGYRGMKVVQTSCSNPQSFLIAFGESGGGHPDAFVLSSNIYIWSLPIRIEVSGSEYKKFRAFRTTEDGAEQFTEIGVFNLDEGAIIYDPPQGSTTTFIGVKD